MSSRFIQTETTPNPNTIKLYPWGKIVMKSGVADFPSKKEAESSDLAYGLFLIQGVERVFFGNDFISVTKNETISWDILKPDVIAMIADYFVENTDGVKINFEDQDIDEDFEKKDTHVVNMIKDIIENKIRASVMADGGDIVFHGYKEGIVYLKLRGACAGCPSASYTLKSGIENMLKHYIPNIKSVEAVE